MKLTATPFRETTKRPFVTSNYKVKFMCSYDSKIQPRPHDHQLAYVSGDTKILVVDRNIKLFVFISKLSSLCDTSIDAVYFKYQLPGKDLDILISVTNDEDLDHMMVEYGRLYSASAKPTRLQLFLFPLDSNTSIGSLDGSSLTAPVMASSTNPDFLGIATMKNR
ncbi:unnamed protein product [Malus baccata var. baccata]